MLQDEKMSPSVRKKVRTNSSTRVVPVRKISLSQQTNSSSAGWNLGKVILNKRLSTGARTPPSYKKGGIAQAQSDSIYQTRRPLKKKKRKKNPPHSGHDQAKQSHPHTHPPGPSIHPSILRTYIFVQRLVHTYSRSKKRLELELETRKRFRER